MKLKFLAEVVIDVDPAHLAEAHRDLLADRMVKVHGQEMAVCRNLGWDGGLIVAKEPTVEALIEAAKGDRET